MWTYPSPAKISGFIYYIKNSFNKHINSFSLHIYSITHNFYNSCFGPVGMGASTAELTTEHNFYSLTAC